MGLDVNQIANTFLGALFAFIFSIFLFHLSNKWSKDRGREILKKNLRSEIEFNLNLSKSIQSDLERVIRSITSDSVAFLIAPSRLSQFQSLFINKSFQDGLLYELFDGDEILEIDDMIRYFGAGTQDIINNYIDTYRKDSKQKSFVLQMLEYNLESVKKHKKLLQKLQKKAK